MRVLLIKTSSMGDVIHTLPALTDAKRALPDVVFDWVVEEDFAPIAALHPAVGRVIPFALRRWRKHIIASLCSDEWKKFRATLKQEKYDLVIDAQGLLKSAWLTQLVDAPSIGLDKKSLREPLARFFYKKTIAVSKNQHAIERVRQLFAQALGYPLPMQQGQYGIHHAVVQRAKSNRVIFLHGTTWQTKEWPVMYWQALAQQLQQRGYAVAAPWHGEIQHARVMQLSEAGVLGLGQLPLEQLLEHIAQAKAVVSVDSGLGHLAAALHIPTVFLYGPTNPQLTGGYGVTQISLSSTLHCAPCIQEHCRYSGDKTQFTVTPPCFAEITPQTVYQALCALVEQRS